MWRTKAYHDASASAVAGAAISAEASAPAHCGQPKRVKKRASISRKKSPVIIAGSATLAFACRKKCSSASGAIR